MITIQSHVDFESKTRGDEVISYSLDTSNFIKIDPYIVQKVNLYY